MAFGMKAHNFCAFAIQEWHCGDGERHFPAGDFVKQPEKASDRVSNGNLVHARELGITAVTTVSELFDLIDLPHRITKHAQVSLVPTGCYPYSEVPQMVLRIEWRGEGE